MSDRYFSQEAPSIPHLSEGELADLRSDVQAAFARVQADIEGASATSRIYVQSGTASSSDDGSLARPFHTLAAAVAAAVVIQTADPTQLVAIVVADGSVFAEDLNLENVNLTKLVVTSASGLNTISAQALQAAVDTENLTRLHVVGFNFSALSALECDVSGALNLFLSEYLPVMSSLTNCKFEAGLSLKAGVYLVLDNTEIFVDYEQENFRQVHGLGKSAINDFGGSCKLTWDANATLPASGTSGYLKCYAGFSFQATPIIEQKGASGTIYLDMQAGSYGTSGGNATLTRDAGSAKMYLYSVNVRWAVTVNAGCQVNFYDDPSNASFDWATWTIDPAATVNVYPTSLNGAVVIHPVKGNDFLDGSPNFPVKTLQAAAALTPGGSIYLPSYSRSKMVNHVEAFDCDATSVAQRFDTTSLRVGTGAVTTATSPGKCTLTTTAASSDSEGLQLRKTLARARLPRMATKVELPSIVDVQLVYGLYKDADELALISYNPGVLAGNWYLQLGDGATAANVDSGILATADETALELWVDADGTVHWAIDNTELPVSAEKLTADEHTARIQVVTLTTAAKVLNIVRYFEYEELK